MCYSIVSEQQRQQGPRLEEAKERDDDSAEI